MDSQTYTIYPAGGYEYIDNQGHRSSTYNVRPVQYENNIWAPNPTERTPRSNSGSSGHSSEHRRRYRQSGVYLEGDRIVISGGGSPHRRDRERERRRRDREARAAAASVTAEPSTSGEPASQPIPIYRSSTMPSRVTSTETRGRRPIIVEDLVPGERSSRIPIGTEVFQNSSERERRHRRRSQVSPIGYTSAEDENNRRRSTRRRTRDDVQVAHGSFPASAPGPGAYDGFYSSSYDSSYADGSTASNFTSPPTTSPAADAAVKKLRFDDEVEQQRKLQNDKISRRSSMRVSADPYASQRSKPLEKELKGILKNSGTNTANTPAASRPSSRDREPSREPSHERRRSRRNTMDGVTESLSGLAIDREGRTSYDADREYEDRLRRRFIPRRYDSFGPGAGATERTGVYYPTSYNSYQQ